MEDSEGFRVSKGLWIQFLYLQKNLSIGIKVVLGPSVARIHFHVNIQHKI